MQLLPRVNNPKPARPILASSLYLAERRKAGDADAKHRGNDDLKEGDAHKEVDEKTEGRSGGYEKQLKNNSNKGDDNEDDDGSKKMIANETPTGWVSTGRIIDDDRDILRNLRITEKVVGVMRTDGYVCGAGADGKGKRQRGTATDGKEMETKVHFLERIIVQHLEKTVSGEQKISLVSGLDGRNQERSNFGHNDNSSNHDRRKEKHENGDRIDAAEDEETQGQEQPSVYIISPVNSQIPFPSITSLSSSSRLANGSVTSPEPPSPASLAAALSDSELPLTLLDSVALLQYLDLAGLLDSLSEVSERLMPADKSDIINSNRKEDHDLDDDSDGYTFQHSADERSYTYIPNTFTTNRRTDKNSKKPPVLLIISGLLPLLLLQCNHHMGTDQQLRIKAHLSRFLRCVTTLTRQYEGEITVLLLLEPGSEFMDGIKVMNQTVMEAWRECGGDGEYDNDDDDIRSDGKERGQGMPKISSGLKPYGENISMYVDGPSGLVEFSRDKGTNGAATTATTAVPATATTTAATAAITTYTHLITSTLDSLISIHSPHPHPSFSSSCCCCFSR